MNGSSVNKSNKNVFVVVVVLYNPRIIHFARLGICAAMTRNVVKRLDNQNCVNCVFKVIGQSDVNLFYRAEYTENLLGVYYAMNFTRRSTKKHSDKNSHHTQCQSPFTFSFYQTVAIITSNILEDIHNPHQTTRSVSN